MWCPSQSCSSFFICREMLAVLWQKSLAVRKEQTEGTGGAQIHLPPLFEEELALTV